MADLEHKLKQAVLGNNYVSEAWISFVVIALMSGGIPWLLGAPLWAATMFGMYFSHRYLTS